MSPYLDQMDKLIFAHEFGHFLNDYVCWGSYAGTDVAEVHSQAFEYLSLCYTENSETLTRCKMADSLCTYVDQAAYAAFEHRLYRLSGEELTVENVTALYEEVCVEFGQDIWGEAGMEYVTVPHFYTDPLYTLSYVLSNDVALQFYQMELEEPGAGLALYEQCLDTHESYLLTFAETYGLESPFAEGRLEEVAALFAS